MRLGDVPAGTQVSRPMARGSVTGIVSDETHPQLSPKYVRVVIEGTVTCWWEANVEVEMVSNPHAPGAA